MKLTIVLACCLLALVSLASAEDAKPATTSELTDESSDVQVTPADQDADEWYSHGYYGYPRYYYNPYGYNVNYYRGHHYGHWRGRRSAEEKVATDNHEVNADQDANEWYGRSYYGYPYGYRSYYGWYGPWYGRHW